MTDTFGQHQDHSQMAECSVDMLITEARHIKNIGNVTEILTGRTQLKQQVCVQADLHEYTF